MHNRKNIFDIDADKLKQEYLETIAELEELNKKSLHVSRFLVENIYSTIGILLATTVLDSNQEAILTNLLESTRNIVADRNLKNYLEHKYILNDLADFVNDLNSGLEETVGAKNRNVLDELMVDSVAEDDDDFIVNDGGSH